MARLGHEVLSPQIRSEAPAAAKAPPSPPVVVQHRDFGVNEDVKRHRRAMAPAPADDSPRELIAKVRNVSTRAHGELRIELDNDQVWVELQRSGSLAPPVGETVTIKPGALGSYFLSRDSGPALRIKRIR